MDAFCLEKWASDFVNMVTGVCIYRHWFYWFLVVFESGEISVYTCTRNDHAYTVD